MAYWSVCGPQVCEAIHRGCSLIYLRPNGLLAKGLLKATDNPDAWEEDLCSEYADFSDRVAEELPARYPGEYSEMADAVAVTKSRIQLVLSNHHALFVRTGADRTCGYFWNQEGSETLTQRVPLKSDGAHPRIEVVKNSLAITSFKWCLQVALQEAVNSIGEQPNATSEVLNSLLQKLGTAPICSAETTEGIHA